MKKYTLSIIIFLLTSVFSFAQPNADAKAKWRFEANRISETQVEIDVFIEIPENFHMYSFDQGAGGPIPAKIEWNLPEGASLNGGLKSVNPPREYFDEIFEINIRDFGKSAHWKQKITLSNADAITVKATYTYQLCMDDGFCINPFPETAEISVKAATKIEKAKEPKAAKTEQIVKEDLPKEFTANVKQIEATQDKQSETAENLVEEKPLAKSVNSVEEETAKSQTPWWIFIAGFIGGLLAFLTPCVFPMVPMTVSLFIKKERKIGIRDAIIYGLSIIVIYVGLGLVITAIFGPDALYNMSTNTIFNTIFFIVFVVFAISFFGAFELTLPSSWVNKMDKKVDSTSGLVSVFFMAFTLVLVSFSCTAMIIGTLLVESVQTGSLLGPFMGMFGFSIALALPFTLFAIFPSLLKSMPKSGGWLNTIKVFLGFVELALALKFLSMADLAGGWGILPRDVFIAIWIVIMVLLGLYLLGKIKFAHDSELPFVSIPRLMCAIASFSFALYLLPGMWGAPLNALSGYLPPLNTQTFDLYTPTLNKNASVQTVEDYENNRKYADVLDCPLGLNCFFDYEEGLAYAKETNKPVLLDFTGKTCANCRDIETSVWSQPEVYKMINEDYVLISLYMDVAYELPPKEQFTEELNGREYNIKTIGDKWKFFSLKHYKTIAQPLYVVLDGNGNQLMQPIAYKEAKNIEGFKKYLQNGILKLE